MPDMWQEYDCPACGMDFELDACDILAVGESCYCSGCGGHHTAGQDGPTETMLRLYVNGELSYRGLPRDAAEKAAWLAEISHP